MHCGLDFGTSNSTLGTTGADGVPQLLPIEGDRTTIPSAMFFDFGADEVLFGRHALAEYIGGADGRLLRALKSILGSDLIEESIRIKRRVLPFMELLGLFVGELKRRGEAHAGRELDHVVVGRPAHFVDDDEVADARAQRQLEEAVRSQGFRHIEFQYEPIAAALDYERQVRSEELGFVIDLGGGTSDFSIVRVSPDRARAADRRADILATAGVHIGGTDFDRMLALARVMPEFGYQTPTRDGKRPLPSGPFYDLATWHRINRLYTPQALAELRHTRREARDPARVERMISIVDHREGHALAAAVEAAKIALTETEAAEFAYTGAEVALGLTVTRSALARALEAAIARIAETITATLDLGGLKAGQIQTLILTGGSTQIPAIMTRLRTLFPSARCVATDAFGSGGLGLAIDAARKFG